MTRMGDLAVAEQRYFEGVAFSDKAEYLLAEQRFAEALALAPERPSILAGLSTVLLMQERVEEAKHFAERSVAADPQLAEAWLSLGNCMSSEEDWQRALSCFDKAIAINPDMVHAYSARASIYDFLERAEEALDDYRRIAELSPESDRAWFDFGAALHSQGHFREALACFEKATDINPHYSAAFTNRGTTLLSLARPNDAVGVFRQAISLEPDFAPAWSQLGNAFYDLGQYNDALVQYDQAVLLDAASAEALHNRANVLRTLNRLDEALVDFERSDNLNPEIPEALGQYIHTKRQLCAWKGLADMERRLLQAIMSGKHVAIPFAVLSAQLAGQELNTCAATYAKRKFPIAAAQPFRELRSNEVANAGNAVLQQRTSSDQVASETRPIRVGYLSADFRTHPVAFLIAGVMERHDRTTFEIFLYSCGPLTNDSEQLRLKTACSVFRDVSTLSDGAAAKLIAADKIDVLVDLMGITKGHRLGINVLRPAPVIVNWLGYPASLGDPRLADYIVGDPVVTPLAHADHFSEAIAQLPHCYQPNDNSRAIGNRPTRAAAGLPVEGFVFCSFNQSFKISPSIFDLWCRLLAEVPGSVLWLAKPHQIAIDNLRREAEARSVAADRLIFAPHVPSLTNHLGRLQLADLALDTFPYTSHTTGSDALWVGVPLVTMIGETYVSRVAASLLAAVGLPELITTDPESYFVLARSLALNQQRLSAIRARLAENRRSTPLFDTLAFTRNLEGLYRKMWNRHLQGIPGPILASPSPAETLVWT